MGDLRSGKDRNNMKNTVKKTYKIAVALTSVTQTALSFLVPLLIFVFGAKYLTARYDLPQFTEVLGIILGAVSGFYSMIKYIVSATKAADREDEE